MARFLFIFRSENDAHYRMTPEQMQKNHEKWVKWLGDGLRDGWVVDTGDGLQAEGRVIGTDQIVKDGPFVESREVVGGFTIVEAPGIDAAAELAKGCPILQKGGVGGSVEVRPLWGFTLD
jgi:hypothetical protein